MSTFGVSRHGLLAGVDREVRLRRGNLLQLRAEPQKTKRLGEAPELRTPRAPPPPPMPPPPPPPGPPPETEEKLFGINRRLMVPLLVSLPISGLWLNHLWSKRVDEKIVARMDVPFKTKDGVKTVRKNIKMVTGKSGMTYMVGRDNKGRRYMVDTNGILFYESGVPDVGWFAVDVNGDVTNIYAENGQIKALKVGNMKDLEEITIDEFMGMPIARSKITGFRDREIQPLPPDIPLVASKENDDLIPPLFFDEGEMKLEEKKSMNPFRRNDEFKFEPMEED